MRTGLIQPRNSQGQLIVAGAPLTNSTTATDISPTTPLQFAANELDVGQVIEVEAFGVMTTPASAPGTLTLGVYYGGVAGTALAATTAITPVVSAANWPWRLHFLGIVRATGLVATGLIMGAGEVLLPATISTFQAGYSIPGTADTAPVAVDTTVLKSLTIGATWGSLLSTVSITCHGFFCKIA